MATAFEDLQFNLWFGAFLATIYFVLIFKTKRKLFKNGEYIYLGIFDVGVDDESLLTHLMFKQTNITHDHSISPLLPSVSQYQYESSFISFRFMLFFLSYRG